MQNILIIDMFNLCYRAIGTKPITNTSVIDNGLRFINNIASTLGVMWDYVFACYDSDFYWRSDIYPDYKRRRSVFDSNSMTSTFMSQMDALYDITEGIGFKSIRCHGFESDDLVATICKTFPQCNKLIVSNDADLYQLLDCNTIIFNGTKSKYSRVTDEDFKSEYGIHPVDWVMVKAIAGCSSDNIQGIKGIGEKTALAYLRNETSEGIEEKIVKGTAIIERNLKLVTLPYMTANHKVPNIVPKPFNINLNYIATLTSALYLNTTVESWMLNWNQPMLINIFD